MTVLLLATFGCRKSKDHTEAQVTKPDGRGVAPQSNDELGKPVATVDDTVITVKQLQDSINRQSPYIRQRYASKEQKRMFLDNLVRFEVLAKEAARRGLDKDPEVVQTMKSAMITRLLREQLSSGVKPDDVPEADMRAFYQANLARFNKPEEVRVSAVILKKKKQADEVAALARGVEGQSNKGFRDLVARFSTDEETKLRGGDLRYFPRESTDVPKAIVEAAFALPKTGDVAGPIAVGSSFYVLKQTGRRKAVAKTFEQVKREIQNELYKGKREDGQKEFVEGLRAKAKIQVYDEALSKVRVDITTKPAETDSGHGTMDLPAPVAPAGAAPAATPASPASAKPAPAKPAPAKPAAAAPAGGAP